jgi:trk system potassium uptake protein TrkA
MNIIIAGGGQVGRHVAEVLAADGHNVTLIDQSPGVLTKVGESLDIRTLVGHAARAELLLEAGADDADLLVAATNADEINLLSASIAKGLGTAKTIARVHHSSYHNRLGLDYADHLRIDHLVAPEFLTSLEIVGVLRDPGAQAVEHFARGQVELERLTVDDRAPAVGKLLRGLTFPGRARVGTVTRDAQAFIPNGDTVLQAGDVITLIGQTETFAKARTMFRTAQPARQRVVIMGGTPMAVWLARALAGRLFAVRIFEMHGPRAHELAAKLPHTTVLQADPIDPLVFDDENIAEADALVTLTGDDERNILAALQAKSMGVARTVAVIQQPTYLKLIEQLGIDRAFSPRVVATREIVRLCQTRPVEPVATLAEGAALYELRVAPNADVIGKPLVELGLPAGCVLIAIQRGEDIRFPGPHDELEPNDAVVAVARSDLTGTLKERFA